MTLTTTATKAVALGNGANTTWPFTFLIPDLTALTVTLVDVASGNTTVLAPVNYSVLGLSDPNGGTVTYPLSGSPLTSATSIVVERFVDEVQSTDLVNQGGAYPADIEDALDYLTMQVQQLQDQVDRSIVFSVADTVESTLPVASARANLSLTFNSSGAPVATSQLTPGTTVSAAMIPVVTAVTTAAALTALGLPGNLLDLLIPSGTEWAYNAGGTAPTGFVFPIGQACTPIYPNYRAKLIAAGSPYGTNGVDPLMPDRRSTVAAGKSDMGGVNNGLLSGGTVLGAVLGTSTKVLLTANLPAYTPTGTVTGTFAGTASIPVANLTSVGGVTDVNRISLKNNANADAGQYGFGTVSGNITAAFVGVAQGGSSTAFSIVQPTFICNIILKVH